MTGSVLGGNKLRKLEFSLAKAIEQNCDHIVTWGSIASNHCRTTSLLCSKLGLKCSMLQTSDQDVSEIVQKGNTFLSFMTDAKTILCPADTDFSTARKLVKQVMTKLESQGSNPYFVDRGGTQPDAIFAYIDAFEEMLQQPEFKEITDIFVTSGSGGTAFSLALAAKLSESGIRVHGNRIWGNNEDFIKIVHKEAEAIDFKVDNFDELIKSYDEYCCGGYGLSSPEIDRLCQKSLSTTAIPLCKTYTGKTAAAMIDLMRTKPQVFKGNNVLFLHTGGVPGMFGDTGLIADVKEKIDVDKSVSVIHEFLGLEE